MKRLQVFIWLIVVLITSSAFGDDYQFNWHLYDDVLEDDYVASAAKCEALDLEAYRETKFDYVVKPFVAYLVAHNLKKVSPEMELAYYNLRSFHSGRIQGILSCVDSKKKSDDILNKAIEEMGCHRDYK